MNKMRVLILVPDLPDPLEKIKGGIQSAVLNLVMGFASQPVEVLLVSVDKSSRHTVFVPLLPNVTLQHIPEGRSSFSFFNYIFSCPSRLRKVIKNFRPDIIHFEEGMNFLLLRLFIGQQYKHVLTIHGITFAEARLKKNFLQRLKWYQNGIMEWLLLPKHIIHISKYSRQIFLSANKLEAPVIFNAVSSRFFNVDEKAGITNKLLFVGVINNRKNIVELLRAMTLLNAAGMHYRLEIVGDFDPSERYKEEVLDFIHTNGLEEQVNFLGWKSQEELEQIYQDTDIVVLPSLQETLPVVIAETMASGRVMVSSRVGGTPEMIDNGKTGFTYDIGDVNQLTGILQQLHDNSSRIMEIGANARIAAKEKFHRNVIAALTYESYRRFSQKSLTTGVPLFNI